MQSVLTYTATIYVGFKEGYTGPVHSMDEARAICQEVCDMGGLCVTLTATEFVYKNGNEQGVAIGLINYPRFTSSPAEIQDKAVALAKRLLVAFGQQRVSVVFPDKTVMLSQDNKPPGE